MQKTFLNICKRLGAVASAVCIFGYSLFSFPSIYVSAESLPSLPPGIPDDVGRLYSYFSLLYDSFQEGMQAIEHDVQHGSHLATSQYVRDNTTAVLLQILGTDPMFTPLLTLIKAGATTQDILDYIETLQSITVGSSQYGAAGFYKVSGDDTIYMAQMFPLPESRSIPSDETFSAVISTSAHWNISVTGYRERDRSYQRPFWFYNEGVSYTNDYVNYNWKFNGNGTTDCRGGFVDSMEFFSNRLRQAENFPVDSLSYSTSSTIITHTPGIQPTVLFSAGVSASAVSGTVDPSEPWDYYNNTVVPYIHNQYDNDYGVDVVNNWLFFPDGYAPESETPTENPSETTGTGSGCCIHEPFTLPPEWLESNAELDTEHYTMPYTDLVQSPWNVLQGFADTDSVMLANAGEETHTQSVGAFPAEMTVISTIDQLQAFAVGLLDRSGLLAVFASLIAAGFIIRFISIK